MVDPVSSHPARWVRGNPEPPLANNAPPLTASEVKTAEPKKNLSSLLNMSNELSEQGPPIDRGRVAAIRQAIETKTLKIDPHAIAKAMVEFGRQSKS
jgi:flagellar biosynthesis anti-sigma factor FlgM